jgi:negative regulator of sigma E activity
MRRVVLLLATVAGMVLLVVAMGLVPNQRLAEAQSEEDSPTGPTLQFGCDVVKVAAIDPILDPEHPHDHVFLRKPGCCC